MELDAHRTALTGHCYRMLGSAVDAEDAVQETMVRAWKAQEGFAGQAALKTWLYRIATNVCLDEIAKRSRRARPMGERPAGTPQGELTVRERNYWLEPIPDQLVIPVEEDPARRLLLKESIRLAFLSALQNLPGKQRAALLLADVLDWPVRDIAGCLDMTEAAVNSALQRARGSAALREPREILPEQRAMVEKFAAAFERYDVEEMVSLLKADVAFSMPPYELWLQGPDAVRQWLRGRGHGCQGSRLLAAAANGSPAFGQYRVHPEGGHQAWALVVLELEGEAISGWNSFLEVEEWFPRCGLPLRLP